MTSEAELTADTHGGATGIAHAGAWAVFRRGVEVTPRLKNGMWVTAAMALTAAAGRIVVPLLIRLVIDDGITPDGWRPTYVLVACGLALALIVVVAGLQGATFYRLLVTAEHALSELRVKAFAHIHRLSIADHNETKRGTLTARVSSDIEQLARFVQWGALVWIVSVAVIAGVTAVMVVFSWQLTLAVFAVYIPMIPLARHIQQGQFLGYDRLRTRVSETLDATSEIVMGAPVVRAYGYREPVRGEMAEVIDNHYRAQMHAQRYFALFLPATSTFGAAALAVTVGIGVWQADAWDLTSGQIVAFVFLVNLLLNPITEVTEILDQTQTAMASWRKVLAVLDQPVDVADPEPGQAQPLPSGALEVVATGVDFAYRTGAQVLFDVDVEIEAGSRVAIVGETGSGKTTFARLIARLADVTGGALSVGGVDVRLIDGAARHESIRMVPQDGFLFDTTIADNVAFGRAGADRDDAMEAFRHLGLHHWVENLRDGLDTEVGERGEHLSVGERQLVALARAQLADPGLLILDEATSAVDPETEQALAVALDRVAQGRTTVSIAHRLSTAEQADRVLVFDAGRLVEQGHHDELVALGGVYATLYESWLGNTRGSDTAV